MYRTEQSKKNQALLKAIEAQDIKLVKQSIKDGADVNYKFTSIPGSQGSTTLVWAIRFGTHDIVKACLQAGANPDPILFKHQNGISTRLDDMVTLANKRCAKKTVQMIKKYQIKAAAKSITGQDDNLMTRIKSHTMDMTQTIKRKFGF